MVSVKTRPLTVENGEAAAQIFFDAVRNGTTDVYSIEQREAWDGSAHNPTGWQHKFKATVGFAADLGDKLVGFMTLDTDDYIDLAFVRADLSGRGIGRSLYYLIEAHAISDGTKRLTTEASKKAKPFFERMGWLVQMTNLGEPTFADDILDPSFTMPTASNSTDPACARPLLRPAEMTTIDHPTASIRPPKSSPGQSGRFHRNAHGCPFCYHCRRLGEAIRGILVDSNFRTRGTNDNDGRFPFEEERTFAGMARQR